MVSTLNSSCPSTCFRRDDALRHKHTRLHSSTIVKIFSKGGTRPPPLDQGIAVFHSMTRLKRKSELYGVSFIRTSHPHLIDVAGSIFRI